MLACDDVIDVKGQGIDGSRQTAILASLLGAPADLLGQIPLHEL